MGKTHIGFMALIGILLLSIGLPVTASTSDEKEVHTAHSHMNKQISLKPIDISKQMLRFTYDSGLDFEYPDAVRGIYVTGPTVGVQRFDKLLNLVETTDLKVGS